MNANVLHRWLKEHARTGCHRPVESQQSIAPEQPLSEEPAFIPLLRLPSAIAEPVSGQLQAAQGCTVDDRWPILAAADFAQWAAVVVK